MTRHLLMISTLGILLATSTLAQTAPDAGQSDQSAAVTWPMGVTTVFFSDRTMTTLRAADDIRAQWDTLSDTDRTQVKQDCAAIRADDASPGGAATGGLGDAGATGTAATGTSAPGTARDTNTGSGAGDAVASGAASGSGTVDQGTDGFIGDDADATVFAPGTGTTTGAAPETTGSSIQTATPDAMAGDPSATADMGAGTAGDPSAEAAAGSGAGGGTGSAAATGSDTAGEAPAAPDSTLAEGSGMTTGTAGSGISGKISPENLMQICALVNTL